VKILLLGTAAGGGSPQWNCACDLCARCRAGSPDVGPRSQDCVAISGAGTGWYLLNCSPDIRQQVLSAPELRPGPGPRETPLRGALLTDAELDHAMGLLVLRGAAGFRVWAPQPVREALHGEFPLGPIASRYSPWVWTDVVAGEPFALDEGGSLVVTALAVSAKHPKYVTAAMPGTWVVAYRIDDVVSGGSLVYAPCVARWPDGLDALLDGAGCALLDGTFHTADEMSGVDRSGHATAAQRAMGHLPIAGDDGTLMRRAAHPDVQWFYTHLNNTNPTLDARSPERAGVEAADAHIAADGQRFDL